jgi:hypothetical protein
MQNRLQRHQIVARGCLRTSEPPHRSQTEAKQGAVHFLLIMDLVLGHSRYVVHC